MVKGRRRPIPYSNPQLQVHQIFNISLNAKHSNVEGTFLPQGAHDQFGEKYKKFSKYILWDNLVKHRILRK